MKPILILQNLDGDGPGYFGPWLQQRGLVFDLRNHAAGDPFPEHLRAHSGLALLGGEMSANDELPSLRRAEALVQEAMFGGKPVIGHCLGGQLMARALGVRVAASPAPEIGWQAIEVADSDSARAWLGASGPATVFQWHYEAFELPPGAELLASSAACPQQAFAIGPHIGMQFHIEVDADKVLRWAAEAGDGFDALRRHASVQAPEQMCSELSLRLPAHQALADRIYARWIEGLQRT